MTKEIGRSYTPKPITGDHFRPNRGTTGSTWKQCDICGLEWPTGLLKRQRGILVCPEDYDEPGHEDAIRAKTVEFDDEQRGNVWEPD